MAPASVPPPERGSAPDTAAASFFRGLTFGLVGSLPLWALIAFVWWLA